MSGNGIDELEEEFGEHCPDESKFKTKKHLKNTKIIRPKETKLLSVPQAAKLLGIIDKSVLERIQNKTLPAELHVTPGGQKRWKIHPDAIAANPPCGQNLDSSPLVKTQQENGTSEYPPTGYESPLTVARTKREQAQAKIKEMEADEKAGKLVSAEDVKKQAFKEGRRLREAFQNLPGRISAEIACETDPHKVEIILEKEIREILLMIAGDV